MMLQLLGWSLILLLAIILRHLRESKMSEICKNNRKLNRQQKPCLDCGKNLKSKEQHFFEYTLHTVKPLCKECLLFREKDSLRQKVPLLSNMPEWWLKDRQRESAQLKIKRFLIRKLKIRSYALRKKIFFFGCNPKPQGYINRN